MVHSITAVNSPDMFMPSSSISNIQSVDINQLDQIEEPDNIFASASVNFLEMIQSMHNDQKELLNIASAQDQLSPAGLIEAQVVIEDYQNTIGLTSLIIKQVNKSIETLTHIQ